MEPTYLKDQPIAPNAPQGGLAGGEACGEAECGERGDVGECGGVSSWSVAEKKAAMVDPSRAS